MIEGINNKQYIMSDIYEIYDKLNLFPNKFLTTENN